MRLSCFPLKLAVFWFFPLISVAQTDVLPNVLPHQMVNSAAQSESSLDVSLTLSQAIQHAFEFNPDLLVTVREVDITEAGVVQAKVLPNPELAALTEGLNKGSRTTTIQINQVIELGGKRSSRINAAQLDHEVSLADVASRRAELRANVINAFLSVVNTEERITLATASYQLASQVLDVVKRRVMAGRVSPIEETRASVAELTMLNELNQAKMEFVLAKTRLAAMWGEATPKFSGVVKPLEGDIVSNRVGKINTLRSDYDDLSQLQAQLTDSPQMVRARLEIQRQQAQIDVERSRRIGDITLSVGRKREEEVGRSQTILGIAVPIPLFDRNQGNVLGALRKTDKARDELNAIERRLQSELLQAYERYKSTKEELRMLRSKILPSAENAFDAIVKGFEFGKFNLLEVLEAQRTLFQTKSQYLQVQAESFRSVADIERIAGSAK